MTCFCCDREPPVQRNYVKGKWYRYPIYYINKGTPYRICKRCYDDIFRSIEQKREWGRTWRMRNPNKVRVQRKKWGNKMKKKRVDHKQSITYKGKLLNFRFDTKCGVCNWCRAVQGIDTRRTALHHYDDIYFDTDPLMNTIELCTSCHSKETQRRIK